ncbi:hypothetical protein CDL15_Pgr027519 [Punica granatum]|uniref:Uncharacterized protein n=1 Tax=Punica granatum TaxID=22663 RepID=A0A218XK84_PUNGR|nr:hypothetical protein CDL15_Pgr027519 [Punica granatum]
MMAMRRGSGVLIHSGSSRSLLSNLLIHSNVRLLGRNFHAITGSEDPDDDQLFLRRSRHRCRNRRFWMKHFPAALGMIDRLNRAECWKLGFQPDLITFNTLVDRGKPIGRPEKCGILP